MKHDADVHDTDPERADDKSRAHGPASPSRRRFTRAGLSASAVMTLASRPALATFCSHSGTMSGNASMPGQITCHGMSAGFWKHNESQWSSTACEPGKCNATSYQSNQCMDYEHCTWGQLKAAKSSMPLDRFRDYKSWANFNSTTPTNSMPNPNSPPTTLGELLAGTNLSISDPGQTMMQALWDPPGAGEPDSLLAEVVAAFLNADYFGRDAFGYSMNELRDFIASWSEGPTALKDALHFLNNRG